MRRAWYAAAVHAPRPVVAGALALATATAVASCREPTQVTIEVRTDVPCSLVQKTTITVGAPLDTEEDAAPTAVTSACEAGLVGSLVTVPATSKSARLAVRVVTGVDRDATQCSAADKYKGCIVARRRLAYVAHTPLFVPVFMNLSCKDVPCDVRSTCNRLGQCVPADVAADECSRPGGCTVTGDVPPADAGADATVPAIDGGADALADRQADAPRDGARGDASDGGSFGAGYIQCGAGAPAGCQIPNHCCLDVITGTGACVSQQIACLTGGNDVDIHCDGPNDCPQAGQVCCFTQGFGSSCVTGPGNCIAPNEILCTDPTHCATSCVPTASAPPLNRCQ